MSIQFDSVFKKFHIGISKKEVLAVSDVSFNVEKGEVFGIVGPNGAGKSTLLKMLMGFIGISRGSITLFGKRPDDPESRLHLGYLPENPCFYEHLSAVELMKFGADLSGIPKETIQNRIERLLKLLNIEHAANRKIRSYSKGMVQRAGICFALIHDPECIIFDEPMSGLDPVGRKLLVDLILDLKRSGKTILFCSHILNDVERLCDRIAIMHQGRLKTIINRSDFEDTKQTVSANSLETLFLKHIKQEEVLETFH